MQDALLFQKTSTNSCAPRWRQMDEVRQECDRTRDFAVFKKKQDDLRS
jgi:hypothetical protein